MWVNYPHMPTGALPTTGKFLKNWWLSGRKYNILICHDNPYSFILNENPMSLLSVQGAMDVVLGTEFTQQSAEYGGMEGWPAYAALKKGLQ